MRRFMFGIQILKTNRSNHTQHRSMEDCKIIWLSWSRGAKKFGILLKAVKKLGIGPVRRAHNQCVALSMCIVTVVIYTVKNIYMCHDCCVRCDHLPTRRAAYFTHSFGSKLLTFPFHNLTWLFDNLCVQMKLECGKYFIYQCILIFHFEISHFLMFWIWHFSLLIQTLFFCFHFDFFDLDDETFVNFCRDDWHWISTKDDQSCA